MNIDLTGTWNKVYDWATDNASGFLAIVLTIFGVILSLGLALGLAFGSYCLVGWIAWLVYNRHIAWEFNLPQLGYWCFVGGAYVIHWIGKCFFTTELKVKEDE